MSESLDIGIVGLGVMGGNLARNFASRGNKVGGNNKDMDVAKALVAEHPEAGIELHEDLKGLVANLKRPRRLLLLVPSGGPVDAVVKGLDPYLEEGDVIVDGGNSNYRLTERRLAESKERPWHFVGMGVSGGAEGALKGPSMMPGGDPQAYENLRPLLESIAAVGVDGPCVTWCGHGSAGHFVKMVHNGIEYGDMQLIAEAATILRDGLGFSHDQIADTFQKWNEGPLASFLIEITADIFRADDPKVDGQRLVDAIVDKAGQKGTGRWTVVSAYELGVAIPTIAAAVDARVLSAQRDLRLEAEKAIALPRGGTTDLTVEDLEAALWGAKVASYSQGLELLRVASDERGYETNLAECARIWTAGCIIRAALLADVRTAMAADPAPPVLAMADSLRPELASRVGAWRKVVREATGIGLPVPGLSASLSWLESLTVGRGSAYVIQAQRDYFGSHTFERLDAPGEFVHHDWPRFKSEG